MSNPDDPCALCGDECDRGVVLSGDRRACRPCFDAEVAKEATA